jgi:hypothetical protein
LGEEKLMFIGRRQDNSIYGCWRVKQWEGQEELPDDNEEVVAFLSPRAPIDLSNIDNLDKVLKSIGLLLRQYTNALQAGTHTQKTVAQLKSDFAQIYNNLP